MSWNNLRKYSKWLSQISAAVSLIVVVYVNSKHTFDFDYEGGRLVLISLIAAVLTFIFGVLSLPRWQGFLALIIFIFVAYCLLFTPLYAIP
jgi:hypothetical protein